MASQLLKDLKHLDLEGKKTKDEARKSKDLKRNKRRISFQQCQKVGRWKLVAEWVEKHQVLENNAHMAQYSADGVYLASSSTCSYTCPFVDL